MDDTRNDDNWLHAEVFDCPSCQRKLFRVDHSPFYDEWHLYCDSCSNKVEVSYYDEVVMEWERQYRTASAERHRLRLRAIEERLRPCDCGGRYRHDASRRCPFCNSIAIEDSIGVDLFPAFGCEMVERDPTPEETAAFEAYEAVHVRRTDIWK